MRLMVIEADYMCKKTAVESEIRRIQDLIDEIKCESEERIACQKKQERRAQDKLGSLKADMICAKAQLYDKFVENELDESDFKTDEF